MLITIFQEFLYGSGNVMSIMAGRKTFLVFFININQWGCDNKQIMKSKSRRISVMKSNLD